MFEIADRLLVRLDAGRRIAVATAVSITGSAPRTVGTSMALTDAGEVIGSISGGCIEGALHELCSRVLDTGHPESARFGFDDATAFSVGLSCGGSIEVSAALVDVASEDDWSQTAITQLRRAAAGHAAEVTHDHGAVSRFSERWEPPAPFVIVGANEFSVALSAAAAAVGFRVTVCDPREAFLTAERFPGAEIRVGWPTDVLASLDDDARTVICILSHDDRFDVDLIAAALARRTSYVGAMGSRRTRDRRMLELTALGTPGLERLRSPIGLDLGASTPEETAVAILAEVIAVRNGARANSLTGGSGSIHGADAGM